MRTSPPPLLVAAVLAALIAATALAYYPGLDGLFVFDSVERVVRNEALKVDSLAPDRLAAAAYAGQTSYPQRGLAYISLAANYHLAGQRFDPFAFKLTNLAIHLLNGLLVFALARRIVARWSAQRAAGQDGGRPVLIPACLAAGLWMLHPIQLTSVLYVVQRMTSLSATCVLLGALVYLVTRERLETERRYSLLLMYAGVVTCTAVGFHFKQNAALLPLFIAVLELCLFDHRRLTGWRLRGLQLYFGVSVVLPAIAVMILMSGTALTADLGSEREYDMLQRLLTQARVLFLYSSLLAVPDIRQFGLFHDELAASVSLLEPRATLVAVVAWVAVGTLAVWNARRRAPWAFAVLWFLAGHGVESTVLPLELAFEHRNYVPSVGLCIALAFYASWLWERAERRRTLVSCALVAWLALLAAVTHVRAERWRSPTSLMESLARHHPNSYRSVSGYAFNSVPRDADLSLRFEAFRRAAALDDRVVSPLIEMAKISTALGFYLEGTAPGSTARALEQSGEPNDEMRLAVDGDHNARLIAALDAEVTRRLAQVRPRTDNIVALVSLVDCSLAGSRECVTLRDRATRWHAAALSNPWLPDSLRGALELSTAKLAAIAGDPELAMHHARAAGRVAGGNLAYRLQEATLYALLERWVELGTVLGEVEARFPVRVQHHPTYRDLRERYEGRPACRDSVSC